MNKPRPTRKLAELTAEFMADAFKKQGFASTELVTRWKDIVGAEIAACSEPVKLQWPRTPDGEPPEPATLVLRVEGPDGARNPAPVRRDPGAGQPLLRLAGGRADRAPAGAAVPARSRVPPRPRSIRRKPQRSPPRLSAIADDDLRMALARLGAAVKRG